MKRTNKINKNQGFTLVEVAIVILIGGILLGAAASLLNTYIKKTQINTTENRLATIDEGLQLFLNLNGRYPCPAPLTAPIDDATGTFGFEDCAAAADLPGGRGGRNVKVGAVPVRTLNLPDDFSGDAWSGRFTYAVTEMLTDDGTYNRNEGGIFVRDANNNDIVTDPGPPPVAGTAHYIVVSHGKNNAGATEIGGGGVPSPCIAGSLEEENCNDDAVFRSTLLAGTASNANLYDDLVSYRATAVFGEYIPPGAVVAFNLNACPDGWNEFSSAGGRFVIGSLPPTLAVGDTGGDNSVALAETETPYFSSPDVVDLNHLGTLSAGTDQIVVNIGTAANPHENRPAYISLLYCEKS